VQEIKDTEVMKIYLSCLQEAGEHCIMKNYKNVCFVKYGQVDQIRTKGWAGRVARMGEIRNTYKTLVVNPEGKRPFWKT
jgi:hypothetical protein